MRTLISVAMAIAPILMMAAPARAGELVIDELLSPAGPAPLVSGKSRSAHDEVYLLVRPVKMAKWYVQAPIQADGKRNWKTSIYLGDAGNSQHDGLDFDVIALSNPTEPLKEGQVWTRLPSSEIISRVIRVRR